MELGRQDGILDSESFYKSSETGLVGLCTKYVNNDLHTESENIPNPLNKTKIVIQRQ